MLEKVKNIAWWVVTLLFFSCALASFPSLGFLLFLIGLALSAPFQPFQTVQAFLAEKGLRGAPKIALLAAALIIGAVATPQSLLDKPSGAEKGVEAAQAHAPETADAERASEAEGADTETPPEAVADPEPEPVSEPEAAPVGETPEPTQEESPPPTEEETPLVGKDIAEARIIFAGSVRNDTTGRWRLARTSEPVQMQEYAVSYYKEYFERDDEVHFVINYTNNTTSVISYYTGILEVDVYSHVDGEEHDAKILPAGERLAQYWVYKDTGEIETL